MTGFSDYTAKNELNWLTGLTAQPALPAVWLALFTTAPTSDAGTGGTEVSTSGTAYARTQIAGNLTTNGTTASGNPTLHFASVPAWIVQGMTIYDATSNSVIPAGTTVLSSTGTTVTMSANATGGGVGGTDVINFSAFSTASGSAPSSITNSAAIAFAAATGAGFGTVTSFGLYDAVTSGNLLLWDYLGNFSWLPATVSSASPGTITAKAHGYSNGDSFVFSTEYGGTAPSFSAGNYTGILTVAGSATDSFNVTGVNTSSTGSGNVRKVASQSIPAGVTASFAASALVATAA